MTRPDAPLIEATAELLEGWCGPVEIRATRDADGPDIWDPEDGETVWQAANRLSCIYLDLRRPEVRDRWSRVRWGASGARVEREHIRMPDGSAQPIGALYVSGCIISVACNSEGGWGLHVPALATLPDTDTLAWACWEVEQAIRAGEDRDWLVARGVDVEAERARFGKLLDRLKADAIRAEEGPQDPPCPGFEPKEASND